MSHTPLYPYIYVNADGQARELHLNERQWLETEYSGGDGAAPHVKDSFDERNGWGDLNGYLRRDRLPSGMKVGLAPSDDPLKPLTREEEIAFFRSKGVEVEEHADGSFTLLAKKK